MKQITIYKPTKIQKYDIFEYQDDKFIIDSNLDIYHYETGYFCVCKNLKIKKSKKNQIKRFIRFLETNNNYEKVRKQLYKI